jgi:hypothetical protein
MPLNITTGIRPGAVRAIIYGVPGVGKTTLATQIPNGLVLDNEDGSGQIDCARVLTMDYRANEAALKELIADSQGFAAVIIDSADWLEKHLCEWMLKQSGKKSIEDYGYGKGYTILQEHFARFLALTDELINKGVHVIFVAHSKVQRVSPPDQTDGYDRYEMKLSKQVAPLLKEWADLILFANYKVQIVEGGDGRLKAQGGKERVLYTTNSAAWDAKNRFGLVDELPMKWESIAHLFSSSAPRSAVKAATVAAPKATPKAPDPEPVYTATTLASSEQVDALKAAYTTPVGKDLIEATLEADGVIHIDELTAETAARTLLDIADAAAADATDAAMQSDRIPGNAPANVVAWLDGNAAVVDAYLVRVGWITAGQSWRDLSDEQMHSIIDRAPKFAVAAKIPALGGAK